MNYHDRYDQQKLLNWHKAKIPLRFVRNDQSSLRKS